MERITKTSKAKDLFINGEKVEAMKIFSSFKIGLTKEERRTLQIAYESQIGHSGFYQSLGIDTTKMWDKAMTIIKNKYGI